jgi:hypothetical protein
MPEDPKNGQKQRIRDSKKFVAGLGVTSALMVLFAMVAVLIYAEESEATAAGLIVTLNTILYVVGFVASALILGQAGVDAFVRMSANMAQMSGALTGGIAAVRRAIPQKASPATVDRPLEAPSKLQSDSERPATSPSSAAAAAPVEVKDDDVVLVSAEPAAPVPAASTVEDSIGGPQTGPVATQLQEWLVLNGHKSVKIDGKFGKKSLAALRIHERHEGMGPYATTEEALEWLRTPIYLATAKHAHPAGTTLSQAAVTVAKRHLQSQPHELKGNRGPWVRLYMRGNEGDPWAWCAGFVQFCVRQAADELGVDASWYPKTFLVKTLLEELRVQHRTAPAEGVLGVVFGWVRESGAGHCGIVTGVEGEYVLTIEGNTNEAGSREGVAVMAKRRKRGGLTFASLG